MKTTPHNKTPISIEKQIINLYIDLYQPSFISKKLSISKSTIDRVLRKHNIKRIHNGTVSSIKERRCLACLEKKLVKEFPILKKVKSRVSSCCKVCTNFKLRKYRKINIEIVRKRNREYAKDRRINCPQYKIKQNLSRRLREVIKTCKAIKNSSTLSLLGCNISDFIIYIESKFTIGMTWDNYGKSGWQIDHIIPCDSFNLINLDEQIKCFHFSNLQPLWYYDNFRKSNKIIYKPAK